MKNLWQTFVRTIFRGLLVGLRFVPLSVASRSAEALGGLGCKLSKRYRDVADKNLIFAFGDSWTPEDRCRVTSRVFRNFARAALAEFLKAPSMSPDQIRKLVHVENWDKVDAVLSRGKGMILVTAHFGNFELLARRAALDGYSFVVVARQSPDEGFNAITDYIRENGGYKVHARGASPKPLLQQLRRGGIIAILPDQKSEDVFVPFFGKLAGTVAGPAVLALKTGAPILPMFCPHQEDGTYKVDIFDEIDTHATGNLEDDSRRIMADITRAIEDEVRLYPDQWLWLHDRWRSVPPDDLVCATGPVAAT